MRATHVFRIISRHGWAPATWLLLACSATGPVKSKPASLGVVDTASVRISLTRTMCFGTCPAYSVEIDGDGKVRFDGGLHVAYGGLQETTLDRSAVAALLAQFETLDYFSLEKLDAESCEDATDSPSAITAIAFDDRSHRVNHYYACNKAPEALSALESAIDSIIGSNRWVAGPSPSSDTLTSERFAEADAENRASVVALTSYWHLTDAGSGKPVYQVW